jgi:hypothetical protein
MQERWKEQLQKTENHPLQPANFHSALNVAISSLTVSTTIDFLIQLAISHYTTLCVDSS